ATITGGAALTVPLGLLEGRCGFTPGLGFSYHSNGGNGPFGLRWNNGAGQQVARRGGAGGPPHPQRRPTPPPRGRGGPATRRPRHPPRVAAYSPRSGLPRPAVPTACWDRSLPRGTVDQQG